VLGQNQIVFDSAQRTYKVWLPISGDVATVRATSTDPGAQVSYTLHTSSGLSDAGDIGIGGGEISLGLPLDPSWLKVLVEAPEGARRRYKVQIWRGCSDCDDGSECTTDSCDPVLEQCVHTPVPDGTLCDFDGLAGFCVVGTCSPGVQCTPGTKRCVGDTAEVCVTAGNAWNQLACSNGCESGECKPLSLETGWVVHQYDLPDDSIRLTALYTFENNGLVAIQSQNAMASVYYNDTELPEGIRVTGRFGVHTDTTNDNDFIGVVFGWQDPEHYYLLDWKQGTQVHCGTGTEGASLKLVDSDTTIDSCQDFWRSAGTSRISPLVDVAQNPAGWKDNTDYDIELIFRPGDIQVTIKEADTVVVTITSSDSTYRSGKFGFYNYSQAGVRYEFFAISPVD
jgi:hypothetical protein